MAKEIKMNITKFLGLWHDNAGDTAIPNGALSQMQNFQILNGYKLRKRSGYSSIIAESFDTPIRGQWYGKINGIDYHVVAVGGKLYIVDSEHSTVTEIGTLTDAKTNFFQFDDILYIQNGYEYMKFGTKDIEDGEELFNSSDYTDPYPETIVLDPGDYHISIGGGSGGTGGGNGGEIAMLINLAVQSTLKVEHLENAGTTKGDAYQILIDDELIAVAGGGGEVGQYWEENSMGNLVLRQTTYYGGDGGGDVASDGTG